MSSVAASTEAPPSFLDRDHAWLVFFAAWILRVAVFAFIVWRFGDAGFILPPFSDGYGYVTLAHNMIDGHGFSRSEVAPFVPDAKRVPLYPLFLAATFLVTGGSLSLAAFLQTMLGGAIAFFVYRMTDMFVGRRAAFFAGLCAAVYPFSIFLSVQILADTFVTFVLLGGFMFFLRMLSSPSYRNAALGGAVMGLATLAKPIAQYIPFLLVPFLALSQRNAQRVSYPAIYIVAFLLVISPWVVRNYYAVGIPTLSYEANILFDLHLAGYTAFKETGSAARAPEYRTVRSEEALIEASRADLVKRLVGTAASDPIGFSQYLLITTVPFVLGDGFVTMVVALEKNPSIPAWDFSSSPSALGRTIGFGVLPPGLLALSIGSKIVWGLIVLASALGFVRLMLDGKRYRIAGIAFVVVIGYCMFTGGPVQSARYRAPVEPLIFLMAGVGCAEVIRIKNRLTRHHIILPAAEVM